MPMGQILIGGVLTAGGLVMVEELAVDGFDLIRQTHIAGGRRAQFEMRRAAFLDADVEDHLAAVAAHCLDVSVHHAWYFREAIFGVAFRWRQGVAFARAERFPHLDLGYLAESVEIEDADARRLRGEQRNTQDRQADGLKTHSH